MPEPMSAEELAAIRSRLTEITDGPWIAEFSGETGHCVIPHDAYSTREALALMRGYYAQLDGEFIAHARTDVPRLLAEVDRLRTERHTSCNAEAWAAAARVTREIRADRDALAAKLDAVHRILTPIDPDWKPLSERYPEHFPPVSAEEQARRDGWGQGVALLTQRIEGALTAPEPPRAPAQPGRERPETPGTGSDTSKRQGVSQAAKNEEDSYAEGGTDAPSAS